MTMSENLRDTESELPNELPAIKCDQCGSTDWRCWEEYDQWFESPEGELHEWPVGFLACNNCNYSWMDYVLPDGWKFIGDDRDAGLDPDYWDED
jgi:hypothetical protein